MYQRGPLERIRGGGRRAIRIARGLGGPKTRRAYVGTARRRLHREQPDPGAEHCLVCGATDIEHRTVHSAKLKRKKPRSVLICGRCGHVSIPDNRRDYRERAYDQLPSGSRIGAGTKPGRDYHIAKLALRAIGQQDVDVLLYGVGASRDDRHIEKLPRVGNVAIGDIMRLRDDGEFIDLTEPPPRRFGLVIASEVVEHFRDPRADFRHMLDFVARDGLLVCGTNVYDGGDLAEDPYIFYSDHTSYYTPRALAVIAKTYGYHIDFRMPVTGGGLRKRYVMFTRSRPVLDRMAVYFGSHTHAPSETDLKLRRYRPSAGRRRRRKA